jgi:hypothetical protein
VAEALGAAREAIDRLLNHRVLRRQSAAVSAESALRGARASAALEGSDVPLIDLRTGDLKDAIAQGALRASAGVGGLVPIWERAPLQTVARLHVLAAVGTLPGDRLGRPAPTADTGRLTALARLVAESRATPGILLSSVVHGELATLAPFGGLDGVIARAAARLTLVTRGVDPKSVSVPEVGHLEHVEEYRPALAAYATGEPAGVATWLRHCGVAIQFGAQEGLAICEAVLRG